MSDKVEQLCMAGAPTEAVLCALMDESKQLRAELTELNARIEDRDAALLNKTIELAECQKQRDELLARIDVVCEVHIISQTYDRIREERRFAADDMEYDLFAAGWKAAIASVKEKP